MFKSLLEYIHCAKAINFKLSLGFYYFLSSPGKNILLLIVNSFPWFLNLFGKNNMKILVIKYDISECASVHDPAQEINDLSSA